jgi:hypothetical protein
VTLNNQSIKSNRSSPQNQSLLKACDVTTMIGLRPFIQFRLRHAATPVRPFSQSLRGGLRDTSNSTPRRNIWFRRLIYFGISGYAGFRAASGFENDLNQGHPKPGSVEDTCEMQKIRYKFENELPIVKQLRMDPDWSEVYVYGNYSEEDKEQRLTSGPLGGSGGLAMQVCDLSLMSSSH